MSYAANITKSIFGRQLGIQQLSSAQLGSSNPHDVLVGVEGVRRGVTTAPTTAQTLSPFGLKTLTTGSSAVHTLGAPYQGADVMIHSSGGATAYVKTNGSETMESSRGSSFTVARFNGYGLLHLIGLTTARWLIHGMGGDSGDSANAPAIALSTST